VRKRRGKNLQRDVAPELLIAGAVNLTHPAGAQLSENGVMRDPVCVRQWS
jgi:hypothetical protein